MIGLLYKEIIVHKKQLLWILPIILIASLFPLIPTLTTPDLESWELQLTLGLSTIITMLVLGMFQQGIFEADENNKWKMFILSAPGGSVRQTGVKYIFTLIFSGLSALLIFIMFHINGSIMKTDVSINTDILMILLAIQLFLRTLEIPFILRFGSKNGSIYRMILTGAVTLTIIIYGLFGDLSIFGSGEQFVKWFMDFFSKDNSLLFRTLPLMVLPFYFLSFLLSCRIYRKTGQTE